jgi:hypothetical protein
VNATNEMPLLTTNLGICISASSGKLLYKLVYDFLSLIFIAAGDY